MRKRTVLVAFAMVLGAVALTARSTNVVIGAGPSGTIATVAGDGTPGFSGDGGPATSAQLSNPNGVALDGAGNLYVADFTNCRVRKVSGGTITTVAGSSVCGFSGDGGQATSARLSNIYGVALDNAGNLYIADYGNCRIRKVSGGIISTIAGTGLCAFGGDGGPATSADLYAPFSVALDSAGNLYIADTGNCRVREVSGATINTVAGGGGCGFSGDGGAATSAALDVPTGIALDSAGDLYIADQYNCRVREVSGGIISTVAGVGTGVVPEGCGYSGDGGSATSAELYYPEGVALDGAGNLYIADTQNCRVRQVSAGAITTFAGNGSCSYGGDGGAATSASLSGPIGVMLDGAGNLYIADSVNNRVREVFASSSASVGGIAEVPDIGALHAASGGRAGNLAWGWIMAAALAAIMMLAGVGYSSRRLRKR